MQMNAVVLAGPNQFSTRRVPIPQISDREILVKMERAAICGTDIRILEGTKTKDVRYPSIIGHELSGSIVDIGKDLHSFSIGDRVAIANVIPCGHCSSCIGGHENACVNRQAIGYEFDGGFAEYVRIPEICIQAGNVIKLSSDVSFAAAALIEPLACCIRGLRNAGTRLNDTVLIVGAGPIGLMHLQLSKIAGASTVIVSEPNPFRREKAKELGADIVIDPQAEDLRSAVLHSTGGLGVDIILLAIGVPSLANDILQLCKRGGTICLFAGFAGAGEATIELNKIHYNEIHLCGSTAYKRIDYLDAAHMTIAGRIDLDRIVTHTFPLEDFQTAYETCKSGVGLKIELKA